MENVWHLRRVADNASKACWICYKPSTSVLITPSNKDHFYICVGHLSDRGFCQPDAEEAAAVEAAKKKAELDKEIEKVKKEYEEKQRLKKEKRRGREKDKDKEKEKDTKATEEEEDKKDEKLRDEKINDLSKSKEQSQTEPTARIFHLNKSFYQMRLDRIRNAEVARRNREKLNNPANFPSVPSGDP